MKPKGATRFDADARKIGDPGTPEGRKSLAAHVIGCVIFDGCTPEEDELAGYIVTTIFGGRTRERSTWAPDEETYERIEAVFNS